MFNLRQKLLGVKIKLEIKNILLNKECFSYFEIYINRMN